MINDNAVTKKLIFFPEPGKISQELLFFSQISGKINIHTSYIKTGNILTSYIVCSVQDIWTLLPLM